MSGYPNGIAAFTGSVVVAIRPVIIGYFIAENNKTGGALNLFAFT
jgi:hypothetical protein